MSAPLHVVTGAFGYTGKYITRELLARGAQVRTLTRPHPNRPNPFGAQIEIAPLDFVNSDELVRNLTGATTLYNTYWVRFQHGDVSFNSAVENTKALFRAAQKAGVRRVVQVSVSNPSLDSPYAYFRGKAQLEKALAESGLSYAIIRPTVIYGPEDILINNIAWLLRRFPVFAIPGSGAYRIQPVSAEDNATLAVDAGESEDNLVLDAAGPEIYSYEALVQFDCSRGGQPRAHHPSPAGVGLDDGVVLGKDGQRCPSDAPRDRRLGGRSAGLASGGDREVTIQRLAAAPRLNPRHPLRFRAGPPLPVKGAGTAKPTSNVKRKT